MHRFYCSRENVSQDKINIVDKGQLHHLKDVLRLKPADAVVVFDDKGNVYQAKIEKLTIQNVVLKIIEVQNSDKARKIQIAVACAIPKKSKMDDIIDKLTQLGADRIIPLVTERVIIKLDRDKKLKRQNRWNKIALSASKQSQRNTVPLIDPVKNLKDFLCEAGDFDLKLIPTLPGDRRSLKEVLTQSKPKKIIVLIGPEGDFSPGELDMAIKNGFIPVSLGDFVLRVETAAVYVVSVLQYEFQ
jgi:16S rRNA (uracil1498-N3)-methyltransferase